MRLNKNMFSLNIYNSYKSELTNNSKAMNNISSGLKLNKAKDNAGKIAQSETLKIQIVSNEAAKRNIQDTNSMIQTFDGAMQEMNNSLSRMKELTVQGANGILSDTDKKAVQDELDQLISHIDYMAKNTDFNGVKLMDSAGSIESIIGSLEDETVTIPKIDLTATTLGISGLDITDSSKAGAAIDSVEKAIKTVSAARSKFGAIQLGLDDSSDGVDTRNLSLQKAQSSIADADMAEEMIKFSRSQILIQSSIGLMAQSNNFPKDALNVLQNIR
ncbi:flagellin [Clostridium saccharobutylicum]|uniref:Flagellin n=1 Tax=Clostridium saccharobutylicum TaxID=169679 RepID=A0A1S8NII0_CLOSA|nr:flagellin [Clostridium saccharobutylicum]OOM16250.1 flagellin [Clostridium saccharobutylicum]